MILLDRESEEAAAGDGFGQSVVVTIGAALWVVLLGKGSRDFPNYNPSSLRT